MCAQSKYLSSKLRHQTRACAILIIISLLILPAKLVAQDNTSPPNTETLNAFIESAIAKHQLDRDFVVNTLQKAKKNQAVLDAIARPWEAKPWHKYHPIFLTEKRLNRGIEFWKTHQKTLEKAQQELGVPAHIIVAIIGVETFYGSYKGKYSVLDSLYSLGFFYPPRAEFFKRELAQYLKLVQEEQWDPLAQKGSYAGAMGWGQFISSSYRHYSIDFDGDNKRDLLTNPVDAIGSVANYFKRHKWKTGEPVAYRVQSIGSKSEDLVNKDLKIKHTWQQLQSSGVALKDKSVKLTSETPAKLLALEQPDDQEYWAVLHNFYVITRYNHSPLYAMVVFQLSESLKEKMESQ